MIKLNLTANGNSEELVKKYLEENASEELANKINNGVKIVKDNKPLLNKKDLKGFMNYANQEARKLAEKNATSACIEDKVVFGWAIHYFEEDSIEGKLFNEDGTEYKPAIKKYEPPKVEVKEVKQNTQSSLFDFIETKNANSCENSAKNNENLTKTQNNVKKQENIEEIKKSCDEISKNAKINKISVKNDGKLSKIQNNVQKSEPDPLFDDDYIIDKLTGEVKGKKPTENNYIDILSGFLGEILEVRL